MIFAIYSAYVLSDSFFCYFVSFTTHSGGLSSREINCEKIKMKGVLRYTSAALQVDTFSEEYRFDQKVFVPIV